MFRLVSPSRLTSPDTIVHCMPMFCRGEADVGRLVTPISLTITNVVLPKRTWHGRHESALWICRSLCIYCHEFAHACPLIRHTFCISSSWVCSCLSVGSTFVAIRCVFVRRWFGR